MRTSRKALMIGGIAVAGIGALALYVCTSGSSAVRVKGFVEDGGGGPSDRQCALSLKTMSGFVLSEKRPEDAAPPAEIPSGRPFEVEFILHGPSDREHWLEISCPQSEPYRTGVFLAPSEGSRAIDLQRITLTRSAR